MIPISLLIAHFIGDFLLQSDWMALNKSKRLEVLIVHVFVYSLMFLPQGIKFWVLTFCTHMIVDFFTSRLTSRLWFVNMSHAEKIGPMSDKQSVVYDNVVVTAWTRHWFFVAIGFDQLVHYLTLAFTYKLLIG